MNMKKMQQEEFDKYLSFDLIPDLQEEYGGIDYIVLTREGKFQFAKECKECRGIILIDREYDMTAEITKISGEDSRSYLEMLTELDVAALEEIEVCECSNDETEEHNFDFDEDFEDSYETNLGK